MRYAGLLIAAILVFSTFTFGQAKTAVTPPPAQPAVNPAPPPAAPLGNTIPPVNPATGPVINPATGGVVNPAAQPQPNQGTTTTTTPGTGVVSYGPAAGGRLITTPEVNLNNANPSTGATSATNGQAAGASNSTISPTTPQVPAAYENANGGLVGISSAWSVGSGGESVADAARQARVQRAKDHPRVFTNEDLARLSGAPLTNNNGAVVTNQNTMPASDVMPSQEQQSRPAPRRSPFQPPATAEQPPQQPQ
jgi:hypothetical protein